MPSSLMLSTTTAKKFLSSLKAYFLSQKDKLLSKVRHWKKVVPKYTKYYYRLSFWWGLNKLRRIFLFLEKYFGPIRRYSFVVIAFLTGLAVNCYGGDGFTTEILSNYLVSSGVMAGGTIAIVFTISIFLLQSAADLYSSQYFEVYIHDWKEKLVYFIVILITLSLLGAGLYIGSLASASVPENISSKTVPLSLLFVGMVFALIDWQYRNVRQKINPSEAISFLEKEGKAYLKKVQYNAEKMAGILEASGQVSSEIALAAIYNRALQPFIGNLDRQLENLVEISMKLSDRQEVETTKKGLKAVHNIIAAFFEARKTSSIIVPSQDAFFAMESDSQSFLSRSYERLNKAGEKLIKEGKDENASYILEIYNSLAQKAKEMQFIGRGYENPVFDQIAGYSNSFIEAGQRMKNVEIPFQGARVLGNLACLAAEKGLQLSIHGIQQNIFDIAVFGLTEKQMVIVDNCTKSFLRIISMVFKSKNIVAEHQFKLALEKIEATTAYAATLLKAGYLTNNFSNSTSLNKGYDGLALTIGEIVRNYFELSEEEEKDRYRSNIVDLFEDLSSSLRRLSEHLKESETTLVDSVGRLIFEVNHIMIQLLTEERAKEEFEDEEGELLKRLNWTVHLPFWFVNHTEKLKGGSLPFETLTDSIAKTGILIAERLGDKKLVIECIKSISSITGECLKKIDKNNSYGYDEPRVLEKACYLGILALKKGWTEVFNEVALKIYAFEPEYIKKYLTDLPPGIDPDNHNVGGLPHKDQLLRELWRWRDDFDRGPTGLRDRAEEMMYSLIDLRDIDLFIFEVWGQVPSDSELAPELENMVRERLKKVKLKKITSLLKGRVRSLLRSGSIPQ